VAAYAVTETSLRRDIEVAVPVERAFAVFTEQFDRVKPREHNMLAVPVALCGGSPT
jgi:hypothetical protein